MVMISDKREVDLHGEFVEEAIVLIQEASKGLTSAMIIIDTGYGGTMWVKGMRDETEEERINRLAETSAVDAWKKKRALAQIKSYLEDYPDLIKEL